MKKFISGALVMVVFCLISTSSYSQLTTYSVTNSSGMVITGVSLSPNDANSWGLSVMTGGNVAADKSFNFTQSVDSKNCIYDIRYTGEDGKYYYVQDVDLCKSTTVVLPNPATNLDQGKTEDKKPDDSKSVNEIKPVDDSKPVNDIKPGDDSKTVDSKKTDDKPTDGKPTEK